MLKVKELIEKLQRVSQEAYVVFDDDQTYKYPVLDVEGSPVDCNGCYDAQHINEYVPCAEVNSKVVKDYEVYCKMHTRRDVVLLTTDYQQSADSIKLVLE